MKRYNQIGTLTAVIVAAVVLLAGCAKNDLTEPGRPQPPAGMGELTLGQLQLLGGDVVSDANRAQTRAGASSNLPEGSTLRLYAFAEGETDFGSKLATRTYTISATGAAQLDAGQEPLFLPKGNADIYLVGPVEHNIGTQTDPVMVEVAAEWGVTPRIGADLIATYAQVTIVAGNTNPLPAMTLEHKMARAQIVVETNPNAVYENLVVQEVKLYGQPTTGTFTLDQTGGVITADERLLEDFVCPSVAKDPVAEKYSATTVLLPQAEREFKIETTFECNQKNTEQGDNHPTLKYRQSGLITAPLAAGTATRFSTQPITPVEIKWRTKVLPWNEVQQDDITTGSELEYNIAIPPMADQYIEINGLKWVKGNLVAKNHFQCMVGEPTDGGLYFQYGSLIGWWGGADGSGVGTPNIKHNPTFQVKPFKFSGTPAYGSNYYTGSTTGVLTDLVADSHTTAIGDPCRYYLGSPWRLPTGEEMGFLCNNSLTVESKYDWGDATNSVDHTNENPSGAWFNTTTPSSDEGLFFPAAGVYHETGYSSGKNQYGYYWSSSIHVDKPAQPRSLHFTLNGVYPQWYYPRTFALPVRCVSGKYVPLEHNPQPPTPDQIIEINGLKWTKGNLVARDALNCKVGAPSDNGLYFQYGGLVGYKAGIVGDGTDIPNATANPGYYFWNGTTTYSAKEVAVKPVDYKKQGTWPYHSDMASGGFGYYYFNTLTTKYADFQGKPGDNDPTNGIGDPCAYYLGDDWRLPKYDELSSITGSEDESTAFVGWGAITGRWTDAGPESAKGAWFGPNSRAGNPTTNTDLFIPASGYRTYDNGSFYNIEVGALLWSSSTFDTNGAFNLYLTESLGVHPRFDIGRTCGLPVRCVSGNYTPPKPPELSYIPNAALATAGWPLDKLPKTGLQVAMQGDKQQPISGRPGTDPTKNWKTETTATAGVESVDDFSSAKLGMGKANTDAMIAAGANLHPAAQYCRDMGPEWYLPSIKELKLIHDNRNLLGSSYSTSRNAYWSSTGSSSGDTAWYINFSDGGSNLISKIFNNNVRCVREI